MQILHFLGHRYFYLLGLALILAGLGWSNFLMSLGQFVILGNWFLNIHWKDKLERLKVNIPSLLLAGLFIIHAVGLLWTNDMDYGIHDLKVKLPLIALPIIIGSSAPINYKEWKILLGVYIGSLFLISLSSWVKYHSLFGYSIENKRELALLISHIRYGLNLVWAAFLLFIYSRNTKVKTQYFLIALAFYFIFCLISFELITGLVCGFISLGVLLLKEASNRNKSFKTRVSILSAFSLIGILIFIQFYSVYQSYTSPVVINYDQNEYIEYSSSGGKYYYDFDSPLKENGVYIWRFVAWDELENEWNKRSEIKYKDKTQNGGLVEIVLPRFLASKGLKKDSAALASLSEEEIAAIESGISNVYYLNHNVIENRIFKSIYELDHYLNYGRVNGFSIAMRLEYWANTWKLIKQNPLIGVGTGDVKSAIKAQYEENNTSLEKDFQKRTHNQYLSIWLGMGVFGFVYFFLMLIYPLSIKTLNHKNLVLSFLLIAGLSFLSEDTLETQAGVTFFALFYSLFCGTKISFIKPS